MSFTLSESPRRRATNRSPSFTNVTHESFESRVVPAATSIYGTWTLTLVPPDVPPPGDPGPYTLVIQQAGTLRKSGKIHLQGNATAIVQIPGEGNVFARKVKVTSENTEAKGKFKSDPLKGSFEAKLNEQKTEIEATIRFLDKSVKLAEDFKLHGPAN